MKTKEEIVTLAVKIDDTINCERDIIAQMVEEGFGRTLIEEKKDDLKTLCIQLELLKFILD